MKLRAVSWILAGGVAAAAFIYGTVDEGPPRTNADRAHELAQDFACPVCAGQSVAESDVPVAREIRRQIAVWVDEGRSDAYIRDQLVGAYDTDIDYNPAATGFTSLVWILPVVAAAGIGAGLVIMLRPDRSGRSGIRSKSGGSPRTSVSSKSGGSPRTSVSSKSGSRSKSSSSPTSGSSPRISSSPKSDDSSTSSISSKSAGSLKSGDTSTSAIRPTSSRRWRTAVAWIVSRTDPLSSPNHPPRRWRTAVAWIVSVVLVSSLAGVLVARFSGSRDLDESITGDIRATTRELIFEAQSALSRGDIAAAISRYDEALDLQPSNTEALTYRGWLTSRTGDYDAAVGYIDDAIAIDPNYPDARLFRAIVALDQSDPARAAAELAIFDSLDPPPFAQGLIEQAQLRQRIANANFADWEATKDAVLAVWDTDPRPAFAATPDLTVDDVLLAAEALATEGRLLQGLQVLDWVLTDLPDDPATLAGRGWLIARSGPPELLEAGMVYLDAALAVDPAHPWALVYRAFVGQQLGRNSAADDLAAFDELSYQPPDLIALINAYNLRDSLATE